MFNDIIQRIAQAIPFIAGHASVKRCALGMRLPIWRIIHVPLILLHEIVSILDR